MNTRNTIIRICQMSLISLLWYSFSSPVSAQSAGLSITPPVVEIMLASNKKIIQTFKVTNQGSTSQFVLDFHAVKPQGTEGQVTVEPAPVDPATLPLILTINNADLKQSEPFTISFGSSRQIVVAIESPTTDLNQDVYLGLVVKPYLADDKSGLSSAVPGISALILTTLIPSGALDINLQLEELNFPLIQDSLSPFTLNPVVRNLSSTMIRPKGKLEIISPRGNHNSELKLFPHLVLGNSSRSLQAISPLSPEDAPQAVPLVWNPSWNNFGPYRIKISINTQGGTTLQEVERVVWLVPFKLIFIVILTIIITLVIALRIRRKEPIDMRVETN